MASGMLSLHHHSGALRRGYAPTLGRYLAMSWLATFLLTLLALGVVIYLVDVVELLRQLAGKNIPMGQAAMMSLLKMPDLLLQLLPFAVLLATLVWLNQLNKRYELVALRASGLPARRFVLAPLLMCALVGVSALLVVNPLAATFLKRYERWYGEVFPNTVKGLVTDGGSIWLRQEEMGGSRPEGRRTYFIYGQTVAANGQNLGQATVFAFSPQGDFLARLDAKQADLENGRWMLRDTFLLSPQQEIAHEDLMSLPTSLTASQIQASFNPPSTLSLWELRRFIGVLEASGFPASRHAMAYAKLLALPALALAMFVLAIPFGLRFVRGQGMAGVVLAGLGLGFGFYLFGNIAAAYGLAGRLDVMLAAWLPTLAALLLAAALLLHLREE
ncbi:MAG: LPS export ABC transporter permease LptG [Proteobacteria bacterium]|nr:LPS export ABC transporter permease LptG [Pseudomonadota bacterium]